MNDRFLKVSEVQAMVCVSRTTIWRWTTGSGLKCWFCVSAAATHEANFHLVARHVQILAGEQTDNARKDIGRLCFVSFDPEAYLNTNATDSMGDVGPDIRLPTASEFCVTTSLNDCVTASLHNSSAPIIANVMARKAAWNAFTKTSPSLSKLYTKIIEPRFLAMAGERNDFIVQVLIPPPVATKQEPRYE